MPEKDNKLESAKYLSFSIRLGKQNKEIRVETTKALNVFSFVVGLITLLAALADFIPVVSRLFWGH